MTKKILKYIFIRSHFIILIGLSLSVLLPLAAYSYKNRLELNDLKKTIERPQPESKTPEAESEKPFNEKYLENRQRIYYPVTKIIDGDTIVVDIDGKKEQVRFLGINTPEIGQNPECYANEAKQFLENLLKNQKIFLLEDYENTDRDVYNRLLRYVYLADNTQLNSLLLSEGYARYYSYFQIAYTNLFKKLQQQAKNHQKGLWKFCEG